MKKYLLKHYIDDTMFQEYMINNNNDDVILFNQSNIYDRRFRKQIWSLFPEI